MFWKSKMIPMRQRPKESVLLARNRADKARVRSADDVVFHLVLKGEEDSLCGVASEIVAEVTFDGFPVVRNGIQVCRPCEDRYIVRSCERTAKRR